MTHSSIDTSCVKFLPVAVFIWWPPTHNWTILCGFLQKMFQFGLTFSRKMVPIQDRPTSFEANHCKETSFKFEFSILPRCSAHLDGGEPLAYVAMPPHFDGWHQDTNLPTVSLTSISAFPPQSFWSGNTLCQWCLLNKQYNFHRFPGRWSLMSKINPFVWCHLVWAARRCPQTMWLIWMWCNLNDKSTFKFTSKCFALLCCKAVSLIRRWNQKMECECVDLHMRNIQTCLSSFWMSK